MNNLNSILLEGRVIAAPTIGRTSHDEPLAKFDIEVNRVFTESETKVTETFRFSVVTQNRTADMCAEYLKADQNVRVVGRLAQLGTTVFIVAEHVEFRPTPTVKVDPA